MISGETGSILRSHTGDLLISAKDCLKKLYVKLNYSPPKPVGEPSDCRAVIWRRFPDIVTFDGQIQLQCLEYSTAGVGAVIAILQVPGSISWEFSFMNTNGKWVTEWHQLNFDIPVRVKLKFTQIALGALYSGLILKTLWWSSRAAALIYKIHEIEMVLKQIAEFGANRCDAGTYEFLRSLKKYESELNDLLKGAGSRQIDDSIVRLDRNPVGTIRFAGTRIG